jgi:hypothetical protein
VAHWGEGVTAEDMQNYIWLKPEIVAEIKFTEWTTGSTPRPATLPGSIARPDKTSSSSCAVHWRRLALSYHPRSAEYRRAKCNSYQ